MRRGRYLLGEVGSALPFHSGTALSGFHYIQRAAIPVRRSHHRGGQVEKQGADVAGLSGEVEKLGQAKAALEAALVPTRPVRGARRDPLVA